MGLDPSSPHPTLTYTNYRFMLGTAVNRAGRSIYVQWYTDDCGASYVGYPHDITTGSLVSGQTISETFSSSTPQARMTNVAMQAMKNYVTLEWTSSMTYMRPRLSTWASGYSYTDCPPYGRINISTTFLNPTDPPVTMDHSRNRFIIGHEMGHRQADEVDGPLSGEVEITYPIDSPHPCNCTAISIETEGCFQNQGYIGWRSSQGWSDFYGAALYHSQDSASCSWKYWRGAYDPLAPLSPEPEDPTWITPGPVSVSCGAPVKWMEAYCGEGTQAVNRGTTQDWLAFFWNLWTTGASRYSIPEITNVWAATGELNDNEGVVWDVPDPDDESLENTVRDTYGFGTPKYWQFVNKGVTTGVNH